MRFRTTLLIALKALKRNLTRAILTALGIIIGIAAVIAMMEIGQGSSSAIKKSIATMGANNLMIQPGTAASGGVSFGSGTITTLTAEDAEVIVRDVAGIRNAAPIVRARAQVIYNDKNWVPQQIFGTTPAFLDVRDWQVLAQGEPFYERDVRNASKVCLIGQTLLRELFGGASPIGENIRIQNVLFKVVGVLSPKGANMMGMDQDDLIVAPWTTIKYRLSASSSATTSANSNSQCAVSSKSSSVNALYPTDSVDFYPPSNDSSLLLSTRLANVDNISASAVSAKELPHAIEEIKELLRIRHRLRPEEPDDFVIRDMAEMTRVLTSTTSLMTRLLLSVALISLVVGGVGIMNIMLVSVIERTHEIGLRMAVGARSSDILKQFLVEAVVLCLSGGIAGIIVGRFCSYLVNVLLKWPTESSLFAVFGAFMVSVSVGIIFGYYPAYKAAKMDPIEALRYE